MFKLRQVCRTFADGINMTRIIYEKKSFVDGDEIHVNEFDFKRPPVDSDLIKLSISLLNQVCRANLNGKKVYESLVYREIPIWWFLYARLTTRFISTIGFIDSFIRFVEEHNPDAVHLENDFSQLDLVRQICMRRNIKFSYSSFRHAKFNLKHNLKHSGKQKAVKLITQKKISSRLNIFHDFSIPTIRDKYLFASYPTYRRHVYDPVTGKSAVGEFIMDDIIRILGTYENSVGIDLFTKIRSDDHVLRERLDSRIPWFPAESLFSSDSESSRDKLLRDFENMILGVPFLELFKFRDISFGDHILPHLREFLFDCYLPYWMDLIDAFHKIFSSSKPKAVFLLFETASPSLALISVCRKFGIKTIGLQHGIIHDSHYLYMHDEVYSKPHPNGFILPDRLLLFGDVTRRYLAECGYPKEALISFCNTTFLNIKDLKTHRERILEEHQLDSAKKIILLALPGLVDYFDSSQNYNKEILERLLVDLKEQFFLVIKPHPADDSSFYEKIVNDFHVPNARVIMGNTIELISISDVIVSTFSTTMIDAMCLGVPVVQARVRGVHYARPYDDFAAVISAPLEDLFATIVELLEDKTMRDELCCNGKTFAREYYNIPMNDPRTILERVIGD